MDSCNLRSAIQGDSGRLDVSPSTSGVVALNCSARGSIQGRNQGEELPQINPLVLWWHWGSEISVCVGFMVQSLIKIWGAISGCFPMQTQLVMRFYMYQKTYHRLLQTNKLITPSPLSHPRSLLAALPSLVNPVSCFDNFLNYVLLLPGAKPKQFPGETFFPTVLFQTLVTNPPDIPPTTTNFQWCQKNLNGCVHWFNPGLCDTYNATWTPLC